MTRDSSIQFADFRLDPQDARLWHGTQAVKLKPKAFAVLHLLVAQAGQLVTKDALWQAVWPDVTVSDDVLAASIRDIRKALGDNAKTPRFIETVHRRGYRWVAETRGRRLEASSAPSSQVSSLKSPPSALVGRDTELAQLHEHLEKALNGERQIVFVTGEAGIGKTSLLEAFLQRLASSVQGPESEKEESQKASRGTWDLGLGTSSSSPQAPSLKPLTPRGWEVGQGQCIEQFGEGEAYLPILTALGQLGRSSIGAPILEVLKQYALSWLVQLPALVPATEFSELRHRTAGTTRPRMLRELTEALEALTTTTPLVLVLEDLHWSDPSTLEWLSFMAKRTSPARLMILGSYRPMEMLTPQHPLRAVVRELRLHQQCQEISLSLLTAMEIATYLTQRLEVPSPWKGEGQGEGSTRSSFADLAQVLYQRTEGNPLFMVSLVDELAARGGFTAQQTGNAWNEHVTALTRDVPNNIRQFVIDQCDRLAPAEQRILEAASVAGMTFSTAAVASALENDIIETEDGYARLAAQQRFLRPAGIVTWPDGTVAAGYGFLHALYQQLWNERVTVSKLQHFHLQIGNRKERAYGDRAGEIALELAVHFEQGRDYHRAVRYLSQAGRTAMQKNAAHEATVLLSKGVDLLRTLPQTPERDQQELTLQITLGSALQAASGYSASAVEQAYTRARSLSQQGEDVVSFPALFGLQRFYVVQGQLSVAGGFTEQCLALAEREQDPALLVEAHYIMAANCMNGGEIPTAWHHAEQASTLYNFLHHRTHALEYGHDPGVAALSHASWILWFLGYPDRALQHSSEALTLARTLAHGNSLAYALWFAAELQVMRREWQKVREHGEALIAIATEQVLPLWLAEGTIVYGWTLTEQGQYKKGLAQMQKGLATIHALGMQLRLPQFLAHLTEGYGKSEQQEEGLQVVADALATVNKTGERYYEAELYRLIGELLLAGVRGWGLGVSTEKRPKENLLNPQPLTPNPQAEEAEGHFLKAIAIARQQSAKSWELRATMSLVRLRQQQAMRSAPRSTQHETRNRLSEAHQMLSEVYSWFTEGFDTKDLQEAKALIEELKH